MGKQVNYYVKDLKAEKNGVKPFRAGGTVSVSLFDQRNFPLERRAAVLGKGKLYFGE